MVQPFLLQKWLPLCVKVLSSKYMQQSLESLQELLCFRTHIILLWLDGGFLQRRHHITFKYHVPGLHTHRLTHSLTHTSSSLTPSFPAVYNSPLTMMAESIRGVCGIELPRQRVLPCGCRSRSHRGMKRCGRLALTSLPLLLQPCYLRSTYHPVQTSSVASIISGSGTPHNALQYQTLQINLLHE